MNKASERTKRWMKEHPERTKQLRIQRKERELAAKEDALRALKRAKYKTPDKAIRAFCNRCPNGTSRPGFPLAPVTCHKKSCPLYPFRNCNPSMVKKARKHKQDMAKVRGAIKQPGHLAGSC
jgi:hypothetical protein